MPEGSRSLASEPQHEPVLAAEVVRLMQPRPDGFYVDCTLGLGGHARALVEAGTVRIVTPGASGRGHAAVYEYVGS